MKKNDTLAVKGIAILCMLFHHLFSDAGRYSAYGLNGLIVNQSLTRQIANNCQVCVAVFAFLSGYGMTKKQNLAGRTELHGAEYSRQSLRSYWHLIRDLILLTPLLVLLTMLFGFSKTPASVWGESVGQMLWGVLTNMTGVAGYCKTDWFVSSWWYIKIAAAFIVLFPLLYEIMKKAGPVCLAAGAVVIIPYLFKIDMTDSVALWRYLTAFIAGMIAAESECIEKFQEMCKSKGWLAAVSIILLVILGGFIHLRHVTSIHYITQTVQAGCIAALTTLAVSKISFLQRGLAFLGKHSKMMWLIHVYFYSQVMKDWLFSLQNIWLIYVVLILISLIASIILEKAFEWIYQKLGNMRVRPRHAQNK